MLSGWSDREIQDDIEPINQHLPGLAVGVVAETERDVTSEPLCVYSGRPCTRLPQPASARPMSSDVARAQA